MSESCYRCGVRADIGCKHRPAEGAPPLAIAQPEPEEDGRRSKISGGGNYKMVSSADGNGRNFHRRKP